MSSEPRPAQNAGANSASFVDRDAARVDALARDVLHERARDFDLLRVSVVDDEAVAVTLNLLQRPEGTPVEITGTGVGLIDAFFNAMMGAWTEDTPSLKTITVSDFQLGSGFDQARGRRSDALAVATLRIKNGHGQEFTFERRTPSITRSSVRVALDAMTFFINAERAYVQLQLALKDATERRRSDLVVRYREQLSVLVHATSYAEVPELRDAD